MPNLEDDKMQVFIVPGRRKGRYDEGYRVGLLREYPMGWSLSKRLAFWLGIMALFVWFWAENFAS